MKSRREKGFTLAEVLIVVAIAATLAVIAIPVVGGALERAKKAADDANMRAARAAFAYQTMITGVKPGKRALFDNVSGKFIERTDWEKARKADPSVYKYYGQSYNTKGGRSLSSGAHSKGINVHIYVDPYVVDADADYGTEALVWWAMPKTGDNSHLWQ